MRRCWPRASTEAAGSGPAGLVHPGVLQADTVGGEIAADARGRAAARVELERVVLAQRHREREPGARVGLAVALGNAVHARGAAVVERGVESQPHARLE